MEKRRDIDPDGTQNLIQAIVDRAVQDYMHAPEESGLRQDAAQFFLSEWFEQLTGLDGKIALKRLEAKYDRKHGKKKGARKH